MAQLQNMEGDAFLKMETGAIPIGEDRSPFMIPMNSSRNGGWGEGKRKYKDKRLRCDSCALQRYILAGAIFSFIVWVAYKIWTSE